MRYLILAVPLLFSACAFIPGYPPAQAQDDVCFLSTAKAAVTGDIHNTVWPSWVPGAHLAAGQVSSCMAGPR